MGKGVASTERLACYLIILLLCIGLMPSSVSSSEPQSDWFSGLPEVHNNEVYHSQEVPYSIDGNRNCTWRTIVTKPERVLSVIQEEESHTSCVVDTGYGSYSQTGYLQVAGETVFGRITYPNGATLRLIPIPRSPHAIYFVSNPPNGVRLFKVNNFIEQLVGTTYDNGERHYKLKSGFTNTELRDRSGGIIGVRYESISFSNSGKWMVADIPFVGMARINISTFEMRVFDSGFNYYAGSEPGMQSAVSMSGKYVAIGSRSHTRFALYDLEDCQSVNRCKKLDLWQFFRAKEPAYIGPGRIRFTSEFSMKFYNVSRPNGALKTETLTLAANGHAPGKFEYLALGDSFASGEGAFEYKAETDTGNNKCHLSQRSYPYLIAEALAIEQMESIACAGAVIEDINNRSEGYEGQVQDNIAREDRDESLIFDNFLPGFIAQDEFLNQYNPESITLSISGNDIGFSDKIKRCLMPDTCYSSYEDRLEIANEINGVFDKLLKLYADIHETMEGKRVYVMGYPSIAADDGNCAVNVRLNAEEIKFSNQLVSHFNKVIKAAADRHGYFYVDVENALKGQRLCEASSFAVAVNGLTAGNDILDLPFTDTGGPIGNESYHPNHIGHQMLKNAVLTKTQNLTAPMPAANPNATPPTKIQDIEMLQNAQRTNRPITQVSYDKTIGQEMAYKDSPWKGFVTGFRPLNKSVMVYLHSDPVLLGTFEADTSGNVSFEVDLPADTPPGYHTIRVVGETLAGSPYVRERVIFVANSKDDIDGDGIPNIDELCLFGEPALVDIDKDGVDDACDGYIGEPPVNEPTPENGEIDEPESSDDFNKIPMSNGDPKPPENNPETVAGHEQTNSEQGVLSVSTEPARTTSYASSPYFANEETVPSVLGSNIQAVIPETTATAANDVKDEADENTNWWLMAVWPAGLVLIVAVLIPIKYVSKRLW